MSLTKPIARPDADPFPGDGEMAVLLRSVDWAATPIGSPEGWPQSLRTSLSICLLSRFPIVLWWGPDLVLLYNDAYRQIIADKHPRAMGMAAREVWPEIWDVIGPMLDGVMTRGEATWSEDQLLFLNRHGFAEECYFTFSYSPIIDESGGVGGVFCAVTETTGQVLRERRLALLRELPVGGPDATAASKAFLDVLRRDVHDLPYAWFIPARDDPPKALAAIDRPTQVLLGAPGSDGDEGARYSLGLQPLPQDPWGAPVERALALPVERPGTDSRWGVLVLGLAPRLALDAEYEDLLRLVAAALGTTMASADALAAERERAEMLAELDRAKTTFFTNISHEFRTPLTLLLGPLDDLAAADLSSRDAERVEMARRNARRLYRLVNALLEFSRIEAGRTQASFEPVDLPTLSRQMASMFRSAFDTAGVGMVIDAEPLPTPVYVDREMWERIVLNLVSNAFKHTHEGEVRVEIRPDGTEAVLVVTDTGVGIAPDELPRVFERFHRVDNPGARTHEGSGIGLALVQELVRLHGGRIHVTSEVGRGSRFEVRVPLGVAHLPPDQVRSEATRSGDAAIARAFIDEALSWLPADSAVEPAAEPATDRPHILVADDNPDMRRYVTTILEPEHEVEVASDGLDALERIAARPPSLILADVMMPRLDGFGLVARLRAEPATRTLPVVLLSARAGEDAAIEGLSRGADDYLVKPFSAGDLRARVAAHLATARLREQAIEDLAAAEAQFRTLVEHNPSGISLLDASGEVTYSNPTWLSYLGGTVEDLRGGGWARNIHPDDLLGVQDELGANIRDGRPFTFEFRARRHDGAFRWFTTTLTPVRDAAGAVQSWIDVSIDIDDRKQAEHNLHVALDRLRDNETELRQALAAKDEFLGMVSHELRTPLTTILGNARVLTGRARSLNAETADGALVDIADEAERLNQVIENLMVLARLEAGRALDLEPVLVARLIGAIVDGERATDPGREYRTVRCDSTLVTIANPEALGQVISNLLSNARKYSPPSEPIEVSCEADGPAIQITVADRGVGVDPAEAERIFEPFFRSARTVRTSGMGIGLSVCRRLIEAIGGTLSAAARPGGGSVFTVLLPLAEEDPDELSDRPAGAGEAVPTA